MKLTLKQKLTKVSPLTLRIVARKIDDKGNPVAITDRDIVSSGLISMDELQSMKFKDNWDDVNFSLFFRYCKALNFDFEDRKDWNSVAQCMKRPLSFRHLRKCTAWSTDFEPLINYLKDKRK